MRANEIICWIAALLLGALAPALVIAIFFGAEVFLFALVITLGHAIILGLPVSLLYRSQRWIRSSTAIVGGAFIGIIPGGFLLRPEGSPGSFASIGEVPTMINGVPTAAGWMEYLGIVAFFGICGAIGAFTFWLTLRVSGLLKVTEPGSLDRQSV